MMQLHGVCIDPFLHAFDLLRRNSIEIGSFGIVLAEISIAALIAALLIGAIGIAEIYY